MIEVKRVSAIWELQGIKSLQEVNLSKNISSDEATREGFLTASYTMDFLEEMHRDEPSIIAKVGETVIGYALVSTKKVRKEHDLLNDLFNTIDVCAYNGIQLKSVNYVVVGQLCVAKDYRGQGLAQLLYNHFKDCLHDQYDYLVTDVAKDNVRSLKAHQKTGFQVISELEYGGFGWDVVLWDWR
jgi:ribosomal protein S18 acetylase RimI-like enzyme